MVYYPFVVQLFFYSLIGGLFSLVGGLVLLWKPHLTKKVIHLLIAFGAGAFLGASFLDILPEAIESTAEPHAVLIATLAGFLLFFVLERALMTFGFKKADDHDHSSHTETLPFLLILGDCIHNFLDGIVIALAFLANPLLGLPTALAIAAHEIPQEIGDFSILLNMGWKRSRIIAVNIVQSLITIPGVLVGLLLGQALEVHLPLLLGATAGVFLYIAATDLIPELHHMSGHKHFAKTIFPLILGIVLLYFLVSLAHG